MIKGLGRIRIISKTVWHGVLGILVELILTALFICAGCAVCMVWWGVAR